MGIEIKGLLKQRESLLKGIDNKEGQDKDDAISILETLERQIEENINNFLEDFIIDYDRSSDVSTTLKIEEIDTQFPYSELSDDQKENLKDLLAEFKIFIEDPDKTDQETDNRKSAIINQKEWNSISIPKEVNKIVKRRANAFHPLDFWIARDHRGKFLFIYDISLKHVNPLQRIEGILSEIKRVSENRQQVIITLLETDNFDTFCELCNDLLLSTKSFKRTDQEENFDYILKKIETWNLDFRNELDEILSSFEANEDMLDVINKEREIPKDKDNSITERISAFWAKNDDAKNLNLDMDWPQSKFYDQYTQEFYTKESEAEKLTNQIFDFFKFSNSPKPSDDLLLRFLDDKVSYAEQLQMNHLIETDAEIRMKISDIKEADNIFDMVIEESGIDVSKSDNPIEDSIEILKIKKKKKDNLIRKQSPSFASKIKSIFIPEGDWGLNIFGKSISLGSETFFSGAALASVGIFALVNIYQVNSPVYQMMLNQSLYSEKNILYNTIRSGDTLSSQEMIAIANKGNMENYEAINDFDNNLQVMINYDDTGETYKLENNSYIKNKRKIQFTFISPLNGVLNVKLIDPLGRVSEVPGFQPIEIEKGQQVLIGSNPLEVKTSLGQELLQINIENSEGIFLGNFFFTTINTKEFERKLRGINLFKSNKAKSISSKSMDKYRNAFGDELPNLEIYSWSVENSNYYYTDYNNDKVADLVAIKDNKKDKISYFVIDTNLNKKVDVLVYPYKNNDQLSYIWMLDENEDGLIDAIGYDYDGDWVIDQTNKI